MRLEGKVKNLFTNEGEYIKAKELGIDMSDSCFIVVKGTNEIIVRGSQEIDEDGFFPIYTLNEILYKLPEWIGEPYNNSIKYLKDAPFYGFCLYTKHDKESKEKTDEDLKYRIECLDEYPIRSAMRMLFQCAIKPDLWYVKDIKYK